MLEISNLTDRDILIRLDTKMEEYDKNNIKTQSEIEKLRVYVVESSAKLEARVLIVEQKGIRQEGQLSGAKALWALITALPAGIVGALLGKAL